MEDEKSKKIAKIMFLWSYILLTIVILGDGNIGTFTVKEAYIPILETIVVTITLAFMGMLGIGETTGIIQRRGLDKETHKSRSMDL